MSETLSDVQAIIATIWRELLKVAVVNPEDNFLDLGGNSLRAAEAASRIQRQLGVEIPIDVVLSEESLTTFSQTVSRELEAKLRTGEQSEFR